MIRAVVFDLDATLWVPEMYQLMGGSPFTPLKETGEVKDRRGEKVRYLAAVEAVLSDLIKNHSHIKLGIASSCDEPEWAMECLNKMRLNKINEQEAIINYFHSIQIYKGNKKHHLQKISSELNIDFSSILFFDNEYYNISNTLPLGVHSIHVPNGINEAVWMDIKKKFNLAL